MDQEPKYIINKLSEVAWFPETRKLLCGICGSVISANSAYSVRSGQFSNKTFINRLLCSETCADMYILQNMDNKENELDHSGYPLISSDNMDEPIE